jgi:phosphatidylinositol alpha-1,6-mannosyltransferase
MPSTGEGFGIAFLEAMASGVPALGLAGDGSVDALGDGELGMVADADTMDRALEVLLAGGTPSGAALAAAVRRRFGPAVFRRGVAAMLHGVATPRPAPEAA